MEYEKIAHQFGTWGPKFKDFIESEKFDNIFKFLKDESREGKVICPRSPDVFRAFRECPYDDLKVIFLLQDPYPWAKKVDGKEVLVADGMAMSCSNTGQPQPSLTKFYEGMETDLRYPVEYETDLSYLAKQGVLLLNTALTTELNKPASHSKKKIWNPFIDHLLREVINFHTRGLVYVSFGEDAHVMAKAVVPFLHIGLEVEHPAFAARKERPWKHEKIFSKINKVLLENYSTEIQWSKNPPEKFIKEELEAEHPGGIRGKVRKS